MGKRWVFRIAAACIIALAGWWILDEDTVAPPPPDVMDAETRPDYFVEGFTMDATNEDGVVTYRLAGERMLHFTGDDLWTLETPVMTFIPETGEPWILRSERGRAWNNVTEAQLEGEVTIRRARGPDNLEANVDTSEVYVLPAERYAETDEFAVYYREGTRISGTGARGYLERDQFELLSEVKGNYVPSQAQNSD
ncbi:MAG: LPS export ABC transporter periplasmic protein LptC [Ectothiorhodospiraceae bacterium]|nr:LPS export ABC transporter periplasmic protein LptC [Ectothiorhodospiraceae bacterium]MCH8504413.1 LPS export ABC transporter periplasmic protein LptC [Ectothiorhodospiraceae bacterium]